MNAEGDTKKTLSSWLWSICQLSSIAAEEGWIKLREEHKITVFTPTETIHVLSGPEPGHVKSTTLNLKINHSKSKLDPLSARDPLVKGPARMRVRMILGNSRISRDRDFFFFFNSHPWEKLKNFQPPGIWSDAHGEVSREFTWTRPKKWLRTFLPSFQPFLLREWLHIP